MIKKTPSFLMKNIYIFSWSFIVAFIFIATPLTRVTAAIGEIDQTKITEGVSTNFARNSELDLIPKAPDLNVKAYILIDARSGNVITAKNPDLQLPPASLTKIMTLYLIADALQSGKLTFLKEIPISEKAWRTEGSRMFAKVGSTVSVRQLIDGIVIASGNDATVAMAEYLSGTEEAFVDLMNKTAERLELSNTNFVDSNGLPTPTHYSSARDLATLTRQWIINFPEYYPWFKAKWIMFNGIKQPNRNRLLWRDPSVDGLKTGYTQSAGYCLAASAERDGMRLIAVLLNAPSDSARVDYAAALFNYGFRFFESRKIYAANTPLITPRVWFGKKKTVPLGVKRDFYVTVPLGQAENLKVEVEVSSLKAPIKKGVAYGTVTATFSGKMLSAKPLVALEDNPLGGFWTKLIDRIILFFKRIVSHEVQKRSA